MAILISAFISCLISNTNFPDYQIFEATAYTNHYASTGKKPDHPAYGITASGKKSYVGMVATSEEYPFGTKIHIEGYGTYIVEDRGGAIGKNKVDIYFEDESEALKFGRRKVRVIILGGNK